MLSFPFLDRDLLRECRAILTLYIATMMAGYSMGYSAVAIPDITNQMKSNSTENIFPTIQATREQLSWFGKFKFFMAKLLNLDSSFQPVVSILASSLDVLLEDILEEGLDQREPSNFPVSSVLLAGFASHFLLIFHF